MHRNVTNAQSVCKLPAMLPSAAKSVAVRDGRWRQISSARFDGRPPRSPLTRVPYSAAKASSSLKLGPTDALGLPPGPAILVATPSWTDRKAFIYAVLISGKKKSLGFPFAA